MNKARQRFISRLLILAVFGVLAVLLEGWANNNSALFMLLMKVAYSILFLMTIIADEFRGRLRADDYYKAGFEEVSRIRFVQVFIMFYLMFLMFVVLIVVFSSINVALSINSPSLIYLVVAPVLFVVLLGRYVVEKHQNPC